MITTDPKFLYLMLLLPAIFGLVLIGEGLHKIFHQELSGFIGIFFGVAFMAVVVMSYLFFSSYIQK